MNCKPGDLAVLVGHPIHAGRLCEVLRPFTVPCDFAGALAVRVKTPGPHWWVKWLGAPMHYGPPVGEQQVGPCPDAWLRPLRGLDDPSTTPTTRELEAA